MLVARTFWVGANAPALRGVGAVGPDQPVQAAFWRLTVAQKGASRPPEPSVSAEADGLPDLSGPSRSGERLPADGLPPLLHVQGRCAGGAATMFLDSGAQLDLVSSEFARKHRLKVEPARFAVGFPDGRDAALEGFVRNVTIRMGSYEVSRDLHVFDLRGQFDVLLGKGWHNVANPVISWRHNQVNVLQNEKWHRFGGSRERKAPVMEPGSTPRVASVTAKQFKRPPERASALLLTCAL